MMPDWSTYLSQLGASVEDFGKTNPEVFAGFVALDKAGHQAGVLDVKTKELISLAVAVTTRCDGCIAVHVDAALKAGCTKEEIAEALGTAIAMNAGAALVYSARVMNAVAAKEEA